jgi:hypothetical protein
LDTPAISQNTLMKPVRNPTEKNRRGIEDAQATSLEASLKETCNLRWGESPDGHARFPRLLCGHAKQKILPKWKVRPQSHNERNTMLGTVLLVLLILLVIGAFPAWPHSKSWGYGPTGGVGLVLVVLVILLALGKI